DKVKEFDKMAQKLEKEQTPREKQDVFEGILDEFQQEQLKKVSGPKHEEKKPEITEEELNKRLQQEELRRKREAEEREELRQHRLQEREAERRRAMRDDEESERRRGVPEEVIKQQREVHEKFYEKPKQEQQAQVESAALGLAFPPGLENMFNFDPS